MSNVLTHCRRFNRLPSVSLTGALYFVALVQCIAAINWIPQIYYNSSFHYDLASQRRIGHILTVDWTPQITSIEPKTLTNGIS